MLFFLILQAAFILILGLATLYILFFAIAGLFHKKANISPAKKIRRMAVLIPGYKEDAVIIEVATSALEQQYPLAAFDVVVIADSFKETTIQALKHLPVKLIEVQFEKSTKSKALNKAMESLQNHYDIAVVLDADNIMGKDFLKKINDCFEAGYKAVQGHRTAKNINNSWAVLDAISEEINNHIFRKGHRAVGLASAIIGSGMAFDYQYFKDMMANVHAVGGFDKEIELKMLKEEVDIMYLDDAYVYDEKIQEAEVFTNQRRRWLAAQFHYFQYSILDATKALFTKGNINYFDKSIQFIQPPRVLLVAAIAVFTAVFVSANHFMNIVLFSYVWLGLLAACCIALIIAIPPSFFNKATFKAVLSLPKGVLLMFITLFKIKGANKTFIHTKHGSSSVNTHQ
jgi:cellulose synthase/poly-beta-1,6-N-acetylglucosamine synthase-like glycosyltransferase